MKKVFKQTIFALASVMVLSAPVFAMHHDTDSDSETPRSRGTGEKPAAELGCETAKDGETTRDDQAAAARERRENAAAAREGTR